MKKSAIGGYFLALTAFACCQQLARAEGLPGAKAIGDLVPNSPSLRDLRGNSRQLHRFTGHKAVVLVFMWDRLPHFQAVYPDLARIGQAFSI